MAKDCFFAPCCEDKQLEITTKEPTMGQIISALDVGDCVTFPISKKNSVASRVCYLNKRYAGERSWKMKINRVNFEMSVIRCS